MSVQVNFADIYLQGMGDRSMQSGMELPWEIQLTDSWTAGAQGKLVLVVLTKPSLGNLFHFSQQEKYRPSIIQITDQFKFFTLRFVKKKTKKRNSFWQAKFFFVPWIKFIACALQENLPNWSSRVQIPRDICTRLERYLCSTKWSWIIIVFIDKLLVLEKLNRATWTEFTVFSSKSHLWTVTVNKTIYFTWSNIT